MPLLNDESIAERLRERESFRVTNVSSKLNRAETEMLDRLAAKRGLQRGELIRQLILRELAAEEVPPSVSVELTEIVGVRLMLTNLLEPLATGQKLTPQTVESIMAEVKKRKHAVAMEVQSETERV